MCYDRVEAGMQPFCVQCCPNNALKIDTLENLVAAHGRRQDIYEFDNGVIVPVATTNPSVIIKV
jgi:Fe-S-cluster-containing dehydrogenase component